MATVVRTKLVRKGDWRTLETFINAKATGVFRHPAGARIKIRYGIGFLGFNRQTQTLNGQADKLLEVSKGASVVRARMQMTVLQDAEVTYTVHLPGPGPQD